MTNPTGHHEAFYDSQYIASGFRLWFDSSPSIYLLDPACQFDLRARAFFAARYTLNSCV